MKLLVTVSGKDMTSFMDQWVFRTGVPRLLASYTFVRKKNFVELKIQQEVLPRCTKFVVRGGVGMMVGVVGSVGRVWQSYYRNQNEIFHEPEAK